MNSIVNNLKISYKDSKILSTVQPFFTLSLYKTQSISSTLDITLPVRLPYNVTREERRQAFIVYPRIFTLKNGDDFVITDVSSDTIYMLTKDKKLTPFINSTPSVHSSSIIKTLTTSLLTDNFMILDRCIFDLSKITGSYSGGYSTVVSLIYEFEAGFTSEVKFVNDDIPAETWNQGVYGPGRVSIPQKNVAATLIQMPELYELYKNKRLKGDLEKLVATLDEYANPIIMIVKFK